MTLGINYWSIDLDGHNDECNLLLGLDAKVAEESFRLLAGMSLYSAHVYFLLFSKQIMGPVLTLFCLFISLAGWTRGMSGILIG